MSKNKPLAEVTSVSYSVALTLKQFESLLKRDEPNSIHCKPLCLDSILRSVTHAESIEFNGHFGAAVFFSLRADCLADSEVVANIIKMYANGRSYRDIFEASKASTYNHKENTQFISEFEYALGEHK